MSDEQVKPDEYGKLINSDPWKELEDFSQQEGVINVEITLPASLANEYKRICLDCFSCHFPIDLNSWLPKLLSIDSGQSIPTIKRPWGTASSEKKEIEDKSFFFYSKDANKAAGKGFSRSPYIITIPVREKYWTALRHRCELSNQDVNEVLRHYIEERIGVHHVWLGSSISPEL